MTHTSQGGMFNRIFSFVLADFGEETRPRVQESFTLFQQRYSEKTRMKKILRRSVRLVLNGYYGSDGKPTVSYHETKTRQWTYRRYIHKGKTEASSADNISCGCSSRKGDLMIYTLKQCLISVIFLALCYGFTCIVPLTTDPEISSSSTINSVCVPGCNDEEGQLQEVKNVMVVLQNKMDYLLPLADMLPNFALKSQGAKVVDWMPSAAHPSQMETCNKFGFALDRPSVHPDIVIQGRTRLTPGECWAFEGSQGHLTIALSYRVVVSHVSLGHLPKMVSPTGNNRSAPKEFSVYGMREPEQEWIHLGTFVYEANGEPVQTFELPSHKKMAISSVKLEIRSNWGHGEYTCLYNFRVHGEMA